MNKIIKEQLEMLKTLEFQVDGKPAKDFPESFSEITFFQTNRTVVDNSEHTFSFEEYIIKPFEGFDFHDKFNKGIAPPERVMRGYIVKESNKMNYVNVRTLDNSQTWTGWIPKKSMKIQQ